MPDYESPEQPRLDDDDIRHTISEAAKILGVSQRSLRYYESAGLISPAVDAFSGYRYYSVRDLSLFREYRELRGMGFSLAEAKGFMLEADFEHKAELLEARERVLEREIERSAAVLEWSRDQRRRYAAARAEEGVLSIRDCPAMIRVDFEYERRITALDRDAPLLKKLQEASPLVFTSVRIPRRAIDEPSLRCVFHRGLAYWERNAGLVPVKIEAPLVRVPERRVIRLVSRTVEICRSSWIDDVNALCARESLEVYDDIIGAYYAGMRIGDGYERYYEFWAPVRSRH